MPTPPPGPTARPRAALDAAGREGRAGRSTRPRPLALPLPGRGAPPTRAAGLRARGCSSRSRPARGTGRGGCFLVWLVGCCLDLSIFFCFVFCFVIFLCVFLFLPFAVQEENGRIFHYNRNRKVGLAALRKRLQASGAGLTPLGVPPRPGPPLSLQDLSLCQLGLEQGSAHGDRGHGLWWRSGGRARRGHRDRGGRQALLTAEGAEVGAGWVVTGWPGVRRLRTLWVLWAVGGEGAGHPGLVCPPRQQGGESRPGRRGRVPPSWLPAPRSPALARHQHPRALHLFPVMEVPGWQVARAWPARADSSRSFLGHLSSARSPQTLPHTPAKA